jgi:hypothetical protein
MTGDLGRWLIVLGVVIIAAGVLMLVADRVPWLGRLPGDFRIERGNWRIYFPLATSLLISVIVTVLLNLFFRR